MRHSLRQFLIVAVASLGLGAMPLQRAMAAAPEDLRLDYQVGSMPGQLTVDQGAANYSIPISVPPGVAGVEPELSFTYSSMGGGTGMGPGWSLTGLSSVTRCGRTDVQDGERFGIEWRMTDRYCLDGQRLILTLGEYGQSGSEYRTELDGFAKIVAHGVVGQGPEWFEVRTKAGQTVEYGRSEDARFIPEGRDEAISWAQNRVIDAAGNYLDIVYQQETAHNEQRPVEIRYAGNLNGVQPSASVRFGYEELPEEEIGKNWLAGIEFKSTRRLKDVSTWVGDEKVSKYSLFYQARTDKPDLLKAVQLCNGTGRCLSPTRFEWEEGENNIGKFGSLVGTGGVAAEPAEACARDFEASMPDFDGDGVQDDYRIIQNRVEVALGKRSGVQEWKNWGVFTSYPNASSIKIVDVNHDGKKDIVQQREFPEILFSNGDDFDKVGVALYMRPASGYCLPITYGELKVVDANQDGEMDFKRIDVYQSDYRDDGMCHSVQKMTRGYYLGKSSVPDLITGITDSLGNKIAVEYVKTQAFGGVPLAPSERNLCSSMYLVSKVHKDSGLDSFTTTSYRFGGAKVHVHGRGMLGFAWDEATDESTGVTTRTEYRQDFPFVGMPSYVGTRKSDGTILSETLSTYESLYWMYPETRSDGSARVYDSFFPYLSAKTEHSYELDGSLVSTVVTTQTNYDDYGNVGVVTVATTAGGETYTKTTESIYHNHVTGGEWHLGRLHQSRVTHAGLNTPTITRESAFTYDPLTGLLTTETVEPNQASHRLTTTYEYDDFGNRREATVVANDGSPRTTATIYDPSGRFAEVATNALGHTEVRTFDERFGKVLTLTGPNGLTTEWKYDDWGRKIAEHRADGTSTLIKREWVAESDNDAPADAYYKVTEHGPVILNAGGDVLSAAGEPAVQYYDKLGRVIRTVTTGFDGRKVYQDTEFDAQGREYRASLPYFAGDKAYWAVNHYDEVNRVYKKTFDTGKEVVTSRVDFQGLITIATDTLGRQKYTRKNALGKVAEVVEEEGGHVTYDYDAIGNLVRTEQHGDNGETVVTEIGYDPLGVNKTTMNDPDMGVWEYGHNAFGELIWQRDAKGQVTTLGYDKLGRMEWRVEPDGRSEWQYDIAPKGVGKLESVTHYSSGLQPVYQQAVMYDNYGRPQYVNTLIEDQEFNTSTDYDQFGRVERTFRPNGFEVRNKYNEYGFLLAKQSRLNDIGDYDLSQLGDITDEAFQGVDTALAKALAYAQKSAYLRTKAQSYEAAGGAVTPGSDPELVATLNALASDVRAAADALDNLATQALDAAEQLLVVAAYVDDRIRQAEYWASSSNPAGIDAMESDAGYITWWRATARDAAGRLAGHRVGNGLVTISDYDPATGHLNTIQTGFEYGGLVRHLEYEYDALNNVTARYDDVQNVRENVSVHSPPPTSRPLLPAV